MSNNNDHKKVMDYLIASHSPLINSTIRRMVEKHPHLASQDKGDLWESAVNGLMSAVHGHDPAKGASLSTYAAQKMGNAMLQRFQPKDISATDRSLAARTRPEQSQDRQGVQSMSTGGLDRGAVESAGGSVGDEGGATGVSVVRNEAADFGRQNPHALPKIQAKVDKYEKQQARIQPPVVADSPPPPKMVASEAPKMVIRRKQVEASLKPEQADRMGRVDAHKAKG